MRVASSTVSSEIAPSGSKRSTFEPQFTGAHANRRSSRLRLDDGSGPVYGGMIFVTFIASSSLMLRSTMRRTVNSFPAYIAKTSMLGNEDIDRVISRETTEGCVVPSTNRSRTAHVTSVEL
jgi:hypothetical protein